MKNNQCVTILSDSLGDLDKNSTDYMIIEEELKKRNPDFSQKERSLCLKISGSEFQIVIKKIFEIIDKYGLTYYQILSGENKKYIIFEAKREGDQVFIEELVGSISEI